MSGPKQLENSLNLPATAGESVGSTREISLVASRPISKTAYISITLCNLMQPVGLYYLLTASGLSLQDSEMQII